MNKFETVKEGPNVGQLVRLSFHKGAPNVRQTEAPRNPSRTGYGAKIPTQWMVRTVDQKWRRVYCMIYSNSGTCYVMHGKARTIVDIEGF